MVAAAEEKAAAAEAVAAKQKELDAAQVRGPALGVARAGISRSGLLLPPASESLVPAS
jgi:hypothetical protein